MYRLALSVIFLSSLAFGSGKITVEDGYYLGAGKIPPPTIGLGIYQDIGKGFGYNMWTGMGYQPRKMDETVRWIASKHEVLKHYGPLSVGIGYAYKHAQQPSNLMPGEDIMLAVSEHKVYGKIAVKLW